ncbi:kinase-like domain-containing protein [Aspergillus leporis]|uniref:cAMP-dependent protein kinase n=1 Tax=Aspergillus leporis TaxID=41062 RepID=A0A5N5X123_9EURO|nr:kinase-like domain-containing protein [Aspergillus leporis]
MPSLGGLLKKRRTKDSQTLSKELEGGSSPTAAQTQTSPNDNHNYNHNNRNHSHSHQSQPVTIPDGSNSSAQPHQSSHDHQNRSSGTNRSHPEGQPLPMQSAVTQSPSAHPQSAGHQHQSHSSNVASISNIIHSSHQSGQSAGGGQQGSQQTQTRTTKGKYTLDDFTLQRTLGTGSFGRVHLVQSKHNHRFYAIKVLKKAQVVKMKQIEHTNDERRMLNRVRHPFLITLWGTWQDPRNLYMVMDFVEGGELFSLLRKSQRFPNPVAKFYAAEVTLALEYLHSHQIIYRDLKPENLLLDRHGHLKITDFGFAKEVPDITWTLCGTPDYLAPEVVSSKGYNKSVDWWSLGILIFEMLCGFTPFWDSGSPVKIYENILRGRVRYPPYLHPDAVDLLSQLITADLTKRLGNLHGGPDDVKKHPWFAEVTWDRLARKDIDAPYVPPIRGGQGDASQYDRYPEETEAYGQEGDDLHGHLFPDF